MQISARNAFGARYVFDGRSHDRLAQRSSGLRMLLGPSPPGNMRRSIAPSVVGTPAPHAAAPYRASGFVRWREADQPGRSDDVRFSELTATGSGQRSVKLGAIYPARKSAFTQPLRVAPWPPAPHPSEFQREITFVLGFQSLCANSVARRLEQTHVETQCEDLMTSQGRRIAGCHLLLRGNRWMPISVNKTLGAKDRCSPVGAVISAYLSAVVEEDTIVGWIENSAFSVQEVLPNGTLAPLDLTPARLALQACDADMEASKAGIVGVNSLIAGRRIRKQNTGNLPSKLREAAFERATVQILDKIQGHSVVGVRLYDC